MGAVFLLGSYNANKRINYPNRRIILLSNDPEIGRRSFSLNGIYSFLISFFEPFILVFWLFVLMHYFNCNWLLNFV
jgi:hypothetical protein